MGIFRQFPYSNFHDMNMDEIIKIVRQLADEWAAYQAQWADLYTDTQQALVDFKAYVQNYFDTLDLSEETAEALRRMLNNGELDNIILTQLSPVITAWLQQHITVTEGVVIDSSLSIAGAAADAKAAGMGINSVRASIDNSVSFDETEIEIVWEQGGFRQDTGAEIENDNSIRSSNSLVIDNIDTIHLVNNAAFIGIVWLCRYDNLTGQYLGRVTGGELTFNPNGSQRYVDVSELDGYVRFLYRYSPNQPVTPSIASNLLHTSISKNKAAIDDMNRNREYLRDFINVIDDTEVITPELTWAQGSVNTTNMYDEVNNLPNYCRSNIIRTRGVKQINVSTENTNNYFVYCRCYDFDGTQLSSERKSITSTNILHFDISDAYFVRLIVAYTDLSTTVTVEEAELFSAYFINGLIENNILDDVKSNLMASFKRFAVIGDSLAAGHIYPDPDSTSGNFDDKSISWGTWITRKLDNTYYNFSRAGMSADQFVTGIHAGDQADLGDNKLACALDGNHDVPLYIINMGINNPNNLILGSTADISLSDPDNNANTIIGWYAKLVQKISLYYQAKSEPVHIVLNTYGYMPAGGTDPEERLRSAGRLSTWTTQVYNYLKATIEAQDNYLHLVDCYSQDPEAFRQLFFLPSGAVVQKHWTSISYNAVGMIILRAINRLIWSAPDAFKRIEFIDSNQYITHYNNPANFT